MAEESLLDVAKGHALEQTKRYRRNRPVRNEGRGQVGELKVSGCSDGRSWVGEAFGLDPGVVGEFTSIGGILRLGWKPVSAEILRWYGFCQKSNPIKRAMFIPTYHFSGGGHGNCAGHHNDIEASIRCAWSLMEELRDCFHQDFLKSVVVGIDTDDDGAIMHACDNPQRKLRTLDYQNCEEDLDEAVGSLYPDAHSMILGYLQALAHSNLRHARQFTENPRSHEQVTHNENGILFGAGVSDWTIRDSFLRVGAYAPNMEEPLATAAGIIVHNHEEVPSLRNQRTLVLSTGTYYDASGPEAIVAEHEATVHNDLAREVILSTYPELEENTDFAVGIVYHHDRSLTIVKEP